MRVIAGYLGGRLFESPTTAAVHPMNEKIRGSIFNTLGNIEGLGVLDVFSGSAALAIEAISRGAKEVICIEENYQAQKVIVKNITNLGIKEKLSLVKLPLSSWLSANQENTKLKFDIILCDPPYDRLQFDQISRLEKFLNSEGILVLSHPGNINSPDIEQLEKIRLKKFGDAQITYYKKS